MSNTAYILEGQNIFDLSLQKFGGIEAVFDLMDANSITAIDESVAVGTEMNLDVQVINQSIVDYYNNKTIEVVSGFATASKGSFDIDFNNDFD